MLCYNILLFVYYILFSIYYILLYILFWPFKGNTKADVALGQMSLTPLD